MVREDVGENTSSEYARQARKARETLNNRDLNPRRRDWKKWLAATAAGAALMFGANAAKNTYDANVEAPRFGEPLSGQNLLVDLHPLTTENGSEVKPTFREDPQISAEELSEADLLARGIDVSSGKLEVREVRGGTYPGNPQNTGSNVGGDEGTQGYGFVVDKENKTNYGIWGEVVVGDKPTGIYVSKNFYPEPKQSQSPENLSE